MQTYMETKVYAGFWVRVVAFAIDSLFANMIALFASIPLYVMASFGVDFLQAEILFQYSLIDIYKYLVVVMYFVLMTYFAHSTLGKMMMRLQVITVEKEWSFVNIVYRETIGRFLSSLLNIGYLVVLGTKRKQGFHDMLCDTYVIYKYGE